MRLVVSWMEISDLCMGVTLFITKNAQGLQPKYHTEKALKLTLALPQLPYVSGATELLFCKFIEFEFGGLQFVEMQETQIIVSTRQRISYPRWIHGVLF